MSTLDVLIAGAGPAGSVAASLLARAGKTVAIVDPLATPSYKIGETLPQSTVSLLQQLGLPYPQSSGPHYPISGVESQWGNEHALQDALSVPGGSGWRLDRLQFDQDLLDTARQHDVAVVQGLIKQIHRDDAYFTVEVTASASLRARAVIDASGRSAALARKLGAEQIADSPLVACWATGRASGQATSDRTLIETVGDNCPDPQAWWYGAVLPNAMPLAALHCSPDFAKQLFLNPSRWQQQLKATQILADTLTADAFMGCRLRRNDARGLHLSQVCGSGWYACGDAALSFNPLASQGIHNAIATASMAANAVLDDSISAQRDYQASINDIRERYRQRLNDFQQRMMA